MLVHGGFHSGKTGGRQARKDQKERPRPAVLLPWIARRRLSAVSVQRATTEAPIPRTIIVRPDDFMSFWAGILARQACTGLAFAQACAKPSDCSPITIPTKSPLTFKQGINHNDFSHAGMGLRNAIHRHEAASSCRYLNPECFYSSLSPSHLESRRADGRQPLRRR
jgi:hypothetical protein